MVRAPGGTLFPTMVMGSLPRPQRIRDLIQDRNAGHISGADAERLLDDAVPLAIRMQEWAGLDFLSDGEWRRTSYVTVFTEAVDGFEPDLVPRAGAPSDQYDPAVVSSINQKRPIAAGEAEFLRITNPVSSSPSHRLTPWAGACGAPSILPRPSRRARISWRRLSPSSAGRFKSWPGWVWMPFSWTTRGLRSWWIRTTAGRLHHRPRAWHRRRKASRRT